MKVRLLSGNLNRVKTSGVKGEAALSDKMAACANELTMVMVNMDPGFTSGLIGVGLVGCVPHVTVCTTTYTVCATAAFSGMFSGSPT